MEADTDNQKISTDSNKEPEGVAIGTTAGGMLDQSILDALTSIQNFVAAWEANNGHPDDHIFYRLTSSSGHYELRLSALRGAGKALQAEHEAATPPRVKQNLSDEERERRRQRMKDYWRTKRGEAANA